MANEGIDAIWKVIGKYREITSKSGVFERHRREQSIKWVHDMVDDHLRSLFAKHPGVNRIIKDIERSVAGGSLPAVAAVQQLIAVFECKS
jgi:LAO/AO transport system kinase